MRIKVTEICLESLAKPFQGFWTQKKPQGELLFTNVENTEQW